MLGPIPVTKEQTHENKTYSPNEPHFDDELTILKARPVVPLKKFDDRRRWFLFGMFALAMFLGASSGLISGYLKLREVSEEPVIQLGVPTVSAPEEPLPSTVSEELDTKNGFGNPLPDLSSLEEQQLKLFTPKRPVIRPRRVSINTRNSVPLPSLSEDEELRRIREALLTDDLERRRVRPTERREQRRF